MSVMLRTMFTRPVDRARVEPLAGALRGPHAAAWRSTCSRRRCPSWLPRPVRAPHGRARWRRSSPTSTRWSPSAARNPIAEGDLLSMLLDGPLRGRHRDGRRADPPRAGGADHRRLRDDRRRHVLGPRAASRPRPRRRRAPTRRSTRSAARRVDATTTWSGCSGCARASTRRSACRASRVNAREAAEDDEIGGYPIPQGTIVAVSGHTVHRDPRFWRDPEALRPAPLPRATRSTSTPSCRSASARAAASARAWATWSASCTLATAFQRYRFEPPPGWAPRAAVLVLDHRQGRRADDHPERSAHELRASSSRPGPLDRAQRDGLLGLLGRRRS